MMQVIHKRKETNEERVKRFKADPVLAGMNKKIALMGQLLDDAGQRYATWMADKEKHIRETYPELQKECKNY